MNRRYGFYVTDGKEGIPGHVMIQAALRVDHDIRPLGTEMLFKVAYQFVIVFNILGDIGPDLCQAANGNRLPAAFSAALPDIDGNIH